MTVCELCGRPIGEGVPSPAYCAVCEQTIESDAAVASLPEVPAAPEFDGLATLTPVEPTA
jgi:hypothetical protein